MPANPDIAIVGGGLAGSLATAMLARAGHSVAMIDPHAVYPPDFRAEKLDRSQVAILRKTGLAESILGAATKDSEAWVAQLGSLVERRPGDQRGILYGDMVNAVRRAIPDSARIVRNKVSGIVTSADRQTISLASGDTISARLVILANGLNLGLRQSLGMERQIVSECHSLTIGFNVKPAAAARFPFSSLSYYGERPESRVAYLTLFPIGRTMRANLMVYRNIHDPWVEGFRDRPVESMHAVMPGLAKLTGPFDVTGHVKIRPADLYVTKDYLRPGIVLAGDAFATSCPAAGTGTGKVFTDVERLCNVYIPRWLASDGMGVEKIAEFYADPEKRAYDEHSATKAWHLRALSTETSLPWQLRRWARFGYRYAFGLYRDVRTRLTLEPANESVSTSA